MIWHVEESMWEAYAAGLLDLSVQASVDTHVAGCAHCRAAAKDHAAPGSGRRCGPGARDDPRPR